MKPLLRLRLRSLLLMVAMVAGFIAIGSGLLESPRNQMRDVQKLKSLGNQPDNAVFGVTVWYSNDLRWNKNRKRHELSLDETTGFKKWISDWAGRDFAYSPISIEIDCDKFGSSTLTNEIIEQIRKLHTIEQVWVEDLSNEQEQARQSTTATLRKIFPDLIIASPQPDPCHDQAQPTAG